MDRTRQYSDSYIKNVFTVWYQNDRKNFSSILDKLPKDEHGRVPAVAILQQWRRKYDWDTQANEMDSQVSTLIKNDLISRKADILRQQAQDSFEIAQKAKEFIVSGSFDTSAAAVNAYFRATEELRKVIGISDFMMKVGKMTDEQIQDEIQNYMRRGVDSGQIGEDGEIIEDNEQTDTE